MKKRKIKLKTKQLIFIFLFSISFLCMTYKATEAQGLLETSETFLLNNKEEFHLLHNKYEFFMGYQPTLFERPHLLWKGGVRSRWLQTGETRKFYYLRGSFSFGGIYERFSLVPTMGTPARPVFSNELLANSQGLPLRYGVNAWPALEGQGFPFKWMAIKFQLRAGFRANRAGTWYQVSQLYTELRYRKFVFSIGRKPVLWQQNVTGSLLQSGNAQNLDIIEISSMPVILPWLFKYMGPIKSEIYFTRMNSERVPKHDYIIGWRGGVKPFRFLEINMGVLNEWGGNGIPGGSTSDWIIEFLGGRVRKGPGVLDTSNIFNRSASVDGRLTFEKLPWPVSIYNENHLEDCCGNLGFLFKKSISYTYGVSTRTGKQQDAFRIRLEYTKTGDALYYHSVWRTNGANNGRVIGNDLGRAAQRVLLQVGKEFVKFKLDATTQFFWQERGRTDIISTAEGQPHIPIQTFQPGWEESEKKIGFLLRTKYELLKSLFLDTGTQFTYVTNKDNISGSDKFEWGVLGRLTYSFN